MTTDLPVHAFAADVVVLKLRDFRQLAPAEQAWRREQLALTVGALLVYWPQDACFVLEAVDSMAIVGLGHPRAAERAAQHAAGGAALAVGLHHGPVQLHADPSATPRASGEGVETAQRLADAAAEGAAEASPAFKSALAQPTRRAWLGVAGVAALLGAGLAVRTVRGRREVP